MSKNDMVMGLPSIPKGTDYAVVLILEKGEESYSEALYCKDGCFRYDCYGTVIDDVEHWMDLPKRNHLADQHQDEPVALPARLDPPKNGESHQLLPRYLVWNACLDEIAKLGPLYSRPVHGEQMAWLRGELDKTLEFVERLRDERETLRADLAETQRISHEEELRANRYSAQVVERDALLYRMAYYLSPALTSHQQWMSKETMHDALSALHEWRKLQGCSASAEPSAPKCGNCGPGTGQACNEKGCGYLESGNGELSAPVDIDEPVAWFTEDHLTDKSATTWDSETAERWRAKGWTVSELFSRAALERKP